MVFWSLTCPFCRRHNVHIEKLHRAAAGSNLLVIGVSTDADRDQITDHVRGAGYTFPITQEAALLAPLFDARRLVPRTYAIARGARLVSAIPGEMSQDDVMELLQLAHRR